MRKENFRLDFAGVGPQRTGSSWLFRLLREHPSLCFPKGIDEPMYFDEFYEKGIGRYIKYFSHHKDGQLCGDISPTYFDTESVPGRIYQLNPECKIIIGIRNPIGRALSLYRHHFSKGRVNGNFSEALSQMPRISLSGKYSRYIPIWLNTFGRGRVLFTQLGEIKANPQAELNRIYNFLGVKKLEMSSSGHDVINKFTMPRSRLLAKHNARTVTWLKAKNLYRVVELGKILGLRKLVYEGNKQELPRLTPGEKTQLLKEYEEDILYLERLLNQDLSAWRTI